MCSTIKGAGKTDVLLFTQYALTAQISCSKIRKAFLQITYLYLLQGKTASQSLQKPEKERKEKDETLGRLAHKNTAHKTSRLSVDLQLHIAPGGCNVVPLKNKHAS